jgi:hypothetical protein
MEFGRAAGRSMTPPEQPMYTHHHKKLKTTHAHENVESRMALTVSKTTHAHENVESRVVLTGSSTTRGIPFPVIPQPSRSHTPVCDRPFEFPRVPAASRGVTPVLSEYPGSRQKWSECSQRGSHGVTPGLSEYSQRSPSPEQFGGGQTVVHHTHIRLGCEGTSVVNTIKPCYMCHFAEETVCAQYATFVMGETARSSRNQIAKQIAQDIVERDMQAGRPPSDGASVADIERHIALHMLSPSVKVPELIRELDDVRRLMRASITNVCPDTGLSTVDTGNVALYLRVVREQIQAYKMGDVAKLSLASAGLAVATLTTDL